MRTKTAPNFPISVFDPEYLLEVLDSGRELILGTQNTRYGQHGLHRVVVEAEGAFIGLCRTLELAHQLRHASCRVLVDASRGRHAPEHTQLQPDGLVRLREVLRGLGLLLRRRLQGDMAIGLLLSSSLLDDMVGVQRRCWRRLRSHDARLSRECWSRSVSATQKLEGAL